MICEFCEEKDIPRKDMFHHLETSCSKCTRCKECQCFTAPSDSHNCTESLSAEVLKLKELIIIREQDFKNQLKLRDRRYSDLQHKLTHFDDMFRGLFTLLDKSGYGKRSINPNDLVHKHYAKDARFRPSREMQEGSDSDEFYSLDGYQSDKESLEALEESKVPAEGKPISKIKTTNHNALI